MYYNLFLQARKKYLYLLLLILASGLHLHIKHGIPLVDIDKVSGNDAEQVKQNWF